ncbi:EndoU domain-containing protein [Vibrio sp. Isolate24]|uniref:EndoU domain-containing protein n=1 Tax=Vibrio sp. Isolate24 TaxID=2908534 RepID=UPI001EFCFF00|nr:EndoU domain-containing protein [Vibrio sp. Isolate24]MCG9677181.1 EndoU domain-containing protein [Vibrio sp. Isolate24]
MKLAISSLALLFTAINVHAQQVPFFDDDPNTAFAPEYTFKNKPIDKEVLRICGEWGSGVSEQDLQSLFENYPDITKKLLSIDESLNIEKLVTLWTKNDGFDHIFCGERESDGSLGGLHYAPRYKELYEMGVISMCPPNNDKCFGSGNEVVPEKGIYSIPTSYLNNESKWKLKPVNGYNMEMNADEILYQATKGYFDLADRRSCFHKIPQTNDHPEHYAVIVSVKGDEITTFYSVGPNGRKANSQRYGTSYCEK